MRRIIVDASVALKWVLDEAHSDAAMALRQGHDLHAPDHWLSEATHVVANAARRGDLSEVRATMAIDTLRHAPVQGTPLMDLTPRAYRIAVTAGITGYDAFYVALAERMGVPLITADQRLIRRLAEARVADGLVRFVGDLA